MILDALVLQTKIFLSEDLSMAIKNVDINLHQDKLVLKDYTSMIGSGGNINLMFVISFETSLLNKLLELFMEGEEVDSEDEQELKNSVSGETLNIIMGLALPSFPNRGANVTITPPVSIKDASNIKKYKDSKIVSAIINTEYGVMSISALGSEDSIN
jgi:chemotaxis protein CheX